MYEKATDNGIWVAKMHPESEELLFLWDLAVRTRTVVLSAKRITNFLDRLGRISFRGTATLAEKAGSTCSGFAL